MLLRAAACDHAQAHHHAHTRTLPHLLSYGSFISVAAPPGSPIAMVAVRMEVKRLPALPPFPPKDGLDLPVTCTSSTCACHTPANAIERRSLKFLLAARAQGHQRGQVREEAARRATCVFRQGGGEGGGCRGPGG
jgi:hypothetical protein